MVYLVKKNKYKNIFHSKLFLLFLVLIIILVFRGAFMVYKKERDTNITLESVARNLQEVEERKAVLLERIKIMNTEKGLEEEIRKRFDLAKEGEKIIMIIDKKDSEISFKERKKVGFFSWIKNIFK